MSLSAQALKIIGVVFRGSFVDFRGLFRGPTLTTFCFSYRLLERSANVKLSSEKAKRAAVAPLPARYVYALISSVFGAAEPKKAGK